MEIKKIYDDSKCCYGSPRITAELKSIGIFSSRPRVARLMRKANIRSVIRKSYRVQTTDSAHTYAVAENLLNRDFSADRIGQKWVSDLTYIQTDEGWLYLTTVIDLADRKVIGWATSETMNAGQTSVAAWQMSIKNRTVTNKLIFHSDRGIQYACEEFRNQLKGFPVSQSMSRKGNCWDNAVAESFFKTLKAECISQHKFANEGQAAVVVFEYIETWYNRKRLHSALGYKSPEAFAKQLNQQNIAA